MFTVCGLLKLASRPWTPMVHPQVIALLLINIIIPVISGLWSVMYSIVGYFTWILFYLCDSTWSAKTGPCRPTIVFLNACIKGMDKKKTLSFMTLSRKRDKLMEFVNVCIYKSFQYYRIKFLQRCNLFLNGKL